MSLICVFVWLFYILLPSYFSCIIHHLRHLVLWLRVCHPIFLTYSNPDSCTLASHAPLGKSDHMVVSVDLSFAVKSTNEHPYHHTVYSYSKADCDGVRDHLRDVPWLDIFKHESTYAAKDHYFNQYHWNATPEHMKQFRDSRNHCKKVLKDARSNYAKATYCSVVSLLIGSCDFWRICNSILNRGKSTILHFLMAERS